MELCHAAVMQNGLALQHVSKVLQTPELCLEAVKQDACALLLMNEQMLGGTIRYHDCCQAAVPHLYAVEAFQAIFDDVDFMTSLARRRADRRLRMGVARVAPTLANASADVTSFHKRARTDELSVSTEERFGKPIAGTDGDFIVLKARDGELMTVPRSSAMCHCEYVSNAPDTCEIVPVDVDGTVMAVIAAFLVTGRLVMPNLTDNTDEISDVPWDALVAADYLGVCVLQELLTKYLGQRLREMTSAAAVSNELCMPLLQSAGIAQAECEW